jgi:hypothetical protein
MNPLYLYLIPTIIYTLVMYRQFGVIVESPKGDPHITTKVLFLIHSFANLAGIWLLFYVQRYEALVFFTIVSAIALYAYKGRKNLNNEKLP